MTSLLEDELARAAKEGNKEEVESILKLPGVNVNAKTERSGFTALHYACEKNTSNHSAIVKLLLDKGAGVEVVANGDECPLYLACKSGCLESVESLIDKGANVSGTSPWGRIHLHTASTYGHSKVVSLLLEKGAGVNATNSRRIGGETALHTASRRGHSKVVSLLLERGADINASLTNGETALHFACKSGITEIVKLLIDKGANVHAKATDCWGLPRTPLQYAGDHVNIVKLLLEYVCIDGTGYNGRSILHDAALDGNSKTVCLLLEKGANVDARDQDGNTPLHLALERGKTQTGLFLMERGASLRVKDNKGCTPLDLFPIQYKRKVMYNLFPEVLEVFTVCQGERDELRQLLDQQKAETTTLQNQVVSLKDQLASVREASSDEQNDKPIAARSSVPSESHEQTQAEITALQKQVQSLKGACSEKDQELLKQLSEKANLHQQVASLQEKLTSCNDRRNKQEGEKAGLSEELRSLQDDCKELRQQKEAEIAAMYEKVKSLEMELAQKTVTPEKQVEPTKKDAIASSNRNASPDNELYETESEEEEEDMVALYDQLKQRHQEWVDHLKKEIESRKNQVDSLNQQLDVYRKREIDALEEKVVRKASKKRRKL